MVGYLFIFEGTRRHRVNAYTKNTSLRVGGKMRYTVCPHLQCGLSACAWLDDQISEMPTSLRRRKLRIWATTLTGSTFVGGRQHKTRSPIKPPPAPPVASAYFGGCGCGCGNPRYPADKRAIETQRFCCSEQSRCVREVQCLTSSLPRICRGAGTSAIVVYGLNLPPSTAITEPGANTISNPNQLPHLASSPASTL